MEISNSRFTAPRADAEASAGTAAEGVRPARGGHNPPPATPATSTADTLTLSAAARVLLDGAQDRGAPVDQGRVAKLRQALVEGTHVIDTLRIARQLLRHDN